MKAWKKLLGLSTVALAILGLAACGGKTNKEDKGATQKEDNGTTTLLMYQVGDKPENLDKLMEIANKRIKEKINATVDLQYISWGDWDKKISTIISSGEAYDIAYAYHYVANAQKGAFADLTDLSKKYAKEYMDQLPESYIKGNTIDGKLYAIPVLGNIWGQQRLTFNEPYLKKYNIDVSKVDGSYESATEVLKQFHEKEPKIAAFAIGQSFKASGDSDYPLGKDYPFTIKLDDSKDPKIINRYEDPDFQKTLKTMREWYKLGIINADAPTNQAPFPLDANTWFMREETQGPMDYGDTLLNNAAKQGVVSRPLFKPSVTTSQAQMANFVVSNTSKHKEKAVEFLNLLNTDPELLNGLVWGVEGEAWEKTGDKKIKLLDGFAANKHMGAWNTGNSLILYTQDFITDKQIKERDESIKTALVSPALGFNPNTDKVKTELSNIMNVMSRYQANLNTGSVDPDETLPKMNKDLKDAGLDKVIKELQSQLDDYLKNNK